MNRMDVRRVAYVGAALATLISGVSGGLGFVAFASGAGAPIREFWQFFLVPFVLGGGVLLFIIGVFLWLARKPQAWGKLLCVIGLPWIAFSAASWTISSGMHALPFNPMLLGPGVCGAALLFVGGVLLVADRGRILGPLAD